MDEERRRQIDELFGRALDRPDDERDAFLQQACSDSSIRSAVAELLVLEAESQEWFDSAPASIARLLAGRRVGPYRLVRPLGHGGMGTVYLATRVDDYRHNVALKLIRWEMATDEALRRFLVERQALARLEHPNIARLYDGGATEGGIPYLVMEFIEGEPIDRFCDRRQWTIRQRLELFQQVCRAVDHAHRNMVVHCDIKPCNVLVKFDGTPKLLDFGIAKALQSNSATVTRSGARPMTPSSASPEQITGGSITTAVDIYGLGILLYELLCGRGPYSAETSQDLARAILGQEPAPPSRCFQNHDSGLEERAMARGSTARDLIRELRGELDAVVLTALRKDPAARYPSARAFADDVGRHLEGLPVVARSTGGVYRSYRWLKRVFLPADPSLRRARRGLFAGLAAGFCVLAAMAWTVRPPRPCSESARWLSAVWNEERSTAVREAFLATGLPFAVSTWERVNRTLDAAALNWADVHRQTCEATHIHREQSERALDARMSCLEGRRQKFEAVVDLFSRADVQVVSKADLALTTLGNTDLCADLDELTTVVPLPADPEIRHGIQALDSRLEEQQLLQILHRPLDPQRLDQILDEARELNYSPLLARALWVRGVALCEGLGLPEEGVEELQAALLAAIAGGDRRLQARLYAALAKETAMRLGQTARAEEWGAMALAARKALGENHPDVDIEIAIALGQLSWEKRDVEASQSWFKRGLEVAERSDNFPQAMRLRGNLGMFSDSRSLLESLIADIEREYGPEHILLARSLHNLAIIVVYQDGPAAAMPLVLRSYTLQRATHGADHPDLAYPLTLMSQLLVAVNRPEESLRLGFLGLLLLEPQASERASILGDLHHTLASGLFLAGRLEEAEEYAGKAASILSVRQETNDSRQLLLALQVSIYSAMGDLRAVKTARDRLFDIASRAPMDGDEKKLIALALGEAALLLGERDRARERLEDALQAARASQVPGASKVRICRALARALEDEDPSQAEALREEAVQTQRILKEQFSPELLAGIFDGDNSGLPQEKRLD